MVVQPQTWLHDGSLNVVGAYLARLISIPQLIWHL